MKQVTVSQSQEVNIIIINLLSVDIVVVDALEREVKRFNKNPNPISINTIAIEVDTYENISLFMKELSYCQNMPDYQIGVYYIVDSLTKQHNPDRPDFLTPHVIAEDIAQQMVWIDGLIIN